MDDHRLREALLSRYERVGGTGAARFRTQLQFHAKRPAWRLIVGGAYLIKRLFDIATASTLLILLDSPGPVFFRQIRVGRYGKLFRMWNRVGRNQGWVSPDEPGRVHISLPFSG